jgi:hypothetical protein
LEELLGMMTADQLAGVAKKFLSKSWKGHREEVEKRLLHWARTQKSLVGGSTQNRIRNQCFKVTGIFIISIFFKEI